jgi:ligand-binding sensor protein
MSFMPLPPGATGPLVAVVEAGLLKFTLLLRRKDPVILCGQIIFTNKSETIIIKPIFNFIE